MLHVLYQNIDAPCGAYQAFVLEKSRHLVKICWKDGLHIMFPYIVTEPPFQHMIREELLVEAKHMFPDAIISIDDIIDVVALDKNGWDDVWFT